MKLQLLLLCPESPWGGRGALGGGGGRVKGGSGWQEQPGALCRDLSGVFLHSLSNQEWMCLCWFWWESPREDRMWVASSLRNPQADVEAEIIQQTLRSHLEAGEEQPRPCSAEA